MHVMSVVASCSKEPWVLMNMNMKIGITLCIKPFEGYVCHEMQFKSYGKA